MHSLIEWMEAFFGSVPITLLDIWGRVAYILGLALAVAAYGRFTFRLGAGWSLGRERQTWNPQAFFSMGLTFVLVPLTGYVGSRVVLVPGVQTLECLKDATIIITVLLFGYPALLAVPPAMMLSELIEGVPADFVLNWFEGYFIWGGYAWSLYQLIGTRPDFRRARTWPGYAGFVALMLGFHAIAWGFICATKFPDGVSYRVIVPAVAATFVLDCIAVPLLMLGALPLARRAGLFWAEIANHVRQRQLGGHPWIWLHGPPAHEGQVDTESAIAEARGAPLRIVLAGTFLALLVLLVGGVAFLSLRSGRDAADQLAARLHQEVAENINLRLDDYMERSQYRDKVDRVADLHQLLGGLTIARQGLAALVNIDGSVYVSSGDRQGDDLAVQAAINQLKKQVGKLILLDSQYPYQYVVVTDKPVTRETWLAQATRYTDNAGRADWIVITAMPQSYYLAPLRAGGSKTATLSAVALTLAFVLAGVLAGMVVAPLRRISRSIEAMAQGDLTQRVSRSHLQELDALVKSFNRMAHQLQESFNRTESSEQTLKTVFNATPIAMVVFDSTAVSREAPDLKAGMRVVDVNSAWQRLTLHPREEALVHSSTELDLWDNQEDRRRFYDAMLADGTVDNFEALQRRQDGSRFFASISLREAAVGKGRLSVLSIEDITARKEAAARLLELNRQLRTMFDAAVEVAIISTDPQGRVNVFNRGAERMLGYAERDALGQSVLHYFVAEEINSEARMLAEQSGRESTGIAVLDALAQDQNVNVRPWRFVRQDGTMLNVSLALSAVHDNEGAVTGYLFLARDVTEQLAAQADLVKLNQQLDQRVRDRTQALQASTEQLQSALDNLQQAQAKLVQTEKLAALGSIVAAVAHELNTPIGICVTVASTLQEKTDGFDQQVGAGTLRKSQLETYVQAQREGMQMLMRALSRARDLVSNFKRVAVDQGGMQKRTRFNLRKTMAEMEPLARIILKNTPYRLEIEVAPEIEMEGFPSAIEQVFTNLVNNSVAHGFGDREHGTMHFGATMESGQVVMRYTDDGKGMTPEVLRRIFDPFFTTSLGKGGSGLGMAISYNLVTGPLGGTIEVSSEPGRGAHFVITVPRVAPIGRGALGDTLSITEPMTLT